MNNVSTFERSDKAFTSQGTQCAAWLYRPTGASNPPVIIMAHGLAAERSFGLPAFAERFAREGFAVFVFDYRTFGDSQGTPRNDVNPFKHNDDWDAAIADVQKLTNIDSSRIALWGTSFSGGHVVCTASRHKDIAAIVSQVPYAGVPANAPKPPLKAALFVMGHILLDRIKTALTGQPHYIPALGRPGSFAVMNTEECMDGYLALVPEGKTFANQIPAKLLGMMGSYNPTSVADQVKCPALVIAGEHDSLIPMQLVKNMAERMPKGIFKSLNANHFAPYKGEVFEENIALQIEFLKDVLH